MAKEGDEDFDGLTPEEGDCDDSTATISPNMSDLLGMVLITIVMGLMERTLIKTVLHQFLVVVRIVMIICFEITEGSLVYTDEDGDGYGNELKSEIACEIASGFSENADDCDDSNDSINPEGTEIF